MEVVLAPWAAFRLFGVPMHQLSETVVDPEEVLGTKIRELTGALTSLPGWEERFVLLDTVLSRWADHGPVCSPQVVWAWRELSRTSGTLSIARLAAETGWGPRHLENRFREQIGLSPKAAARVLRLRHALRLLVGGQAPNQVATACGFSDQAHFNREFKAMTGSSPGRFLADRMANPAGPMSYDRMAGEVTSVVLGT
jgi:AraC-like DNA-binding protein